MIDYIAENKEWLFSGSGAAVITTTLTALFFIIRYTFKYLKSKKAEPIAIESKPLTDQSLNDDSTGDVNSTHPTPKEIGDAIKSAPPFQQKDIEKNYLGIKVKWKVSLALVHADETDDVEMSCHFKGYYRYVHINTSLEDYPEIKILKEGQKITVYGEIVDIKPDGPVVNANKLIIY